MNCDVCEYPSKAYYKRGIYNYCGIHWFTFGFDMEHSYEQIQEGKKKPKERVEVERYMID